MTAFWIALACLTIVPVPLRELPDAAVVARSRGWYPMVGLLLGALLGSGTALACHAASPSVGAFLVLVAWVALTGALHLDGWCDLCDGLFGGASPEARLRILKDPHLGTFGLAGGVLLLLGKWSVVQDLLAREAAWAPWAVAGAVTVARCLVLLMAGWAGYPRAEGTGRGIVEATRPRDGVLGVALAGAVSVALLPLSAGQALLPAAAATGAVAVLAEACRRRLGGITGDCLGAAIEAAELVFLLAVAGLVPRGP